MKPDSDFLCLDLGQLDWKLCGWRPHAWYMRTSMEIGVEFNSDIPPVPALVPGSVQAALLKAGWIKDWNVGLNSLNCEWVEHRHWEFFTELKEGQIPPNKPVVLHAEGLDYSGWILVDNRIAATFQGALLRQRFDLSAHLNDGKAHRLSILFDEPPREQGQIGFTSRSRFFKPRYNYSWDWCPRLVPIGIWDALHLEVGHRSVELAGMRTSIAGDGAAGRIHLDLNVSGGVAACEVKIFHEGGKVTERSETLQPGENHLFVSVPNPRRWRPNGEGMQPLYTIEISCGSQPAISQRIGFKEVVWQSCESAPAGALPWICEVNGRPLFLRGVNWTPIRLDYHSLTQEDYRKRLELYRDMGCNLLRVWGGGFLERQVFYDLCDELGLMVWQEFPLSSSGPENWPPEDPGAIADLEKIARDYIRRRGHHVSKLLWCGGNELQHEEGKKTGAGIPMKEDHPCLAALARVVKEEDPGVRFLPTSSSGPRFMANAREFGQGLHHDVHGPWNLDTDLAAWEKYWKDDDALFRSETGMPGTSGLDILEKYSGECNPWPPSEENPYWLHTGAWWLQWKRFRGQLEGLEGREGLAKFVALSQKLQAEALLIAARYSRERFPRCGGFLLWMGHDAFPCAANTAVIDFEGNPKPAYFALQKVFLGRALT